MFTRSEYPAARHRCGLEHPLDPDSIMRMQPFIISGNTRFFALLISVLVMGIPGWAHHSFDAEFDRDKKMSVDGTVTKVEWINPHSYIYIDVKDGSGKVTNWAVEGFPVGMARRNGIPPSFIKAGDVIHMEGYGSKDGSNRMSGREFTMPDGTKKPFGPPVN